MVDGGQDHDPELTASGDRGLANRRSSGNMVRRLLLTMSEQSASGELGTPATRTRNDDEVPEKTALMV